MVRFTHEDARQLLARCKVAPNSVHGVADLSNAPHASQDQRSDVFSAPARKRTWDNLGSVRAILRSKIPLTADRFRAAVHPGMNERDEWAPLVIRFARECGWREHYAVDSRGDRKGWVDLVLARPPQILFVELKDARRGLTTEQREWKTLLEECEQAVYVWRPGDVEVAIAVLTSSPLLSQVC